MEITSTGINENVLEGQPPETAAGKLWEIKN